MTNRLELRARVITREPLRRTPAGVTVLSFHVEHHSSQREAGQPRDVTVEMDCVAIGEQAQKLEQISPGMELELSGFLAKRSKKSQWMVFHINESELKQQGETDVPS